MSRSLPTAANFLFKLHVAALDSNHMAMTLYPMNDGIFAVGDSLVEVRKWLREVFFRLYLANRRVAQLNPHQVFLARAAIAYGPVIEGAGLAGAASQTLALASTHRDAILLGAPVVNAFQSEHLASPFGVYVHESARTFGPNPWRYGAYMRYWDLKHPGKWPVKLRSQILLYLEHAAEHADELDYSRDAIENHRKLTMQFFDI